ncbi:MAG: oxygenase MpaB family protein [Chthoniobacteraceae bacterium]
MATLLERTGEFTQRTQRRYDDTDLFVSEIMEHGYDSERGSRAIARMNEIHGRFQISNADFLYVLSTFVFEPVRWNARFGWRRMTDGERVAMFEFWRAVGTRMGIEEIPESYEAFEAFNLDFERTRYRFTEAGRHVATSTIAMFARWFPWPLSRAVPPVMHALVDDTLRQAIGLPETPGWLKALVAVSLRVRGRVAHFFTANREPVLRTKMRHRSHPDGYSIDKLGPPRNANQ